MKDFKQLSDMTIHVTHEACAYCLEGIGLEKGKLVGYCRNASKKEREWVEGLNDGCSSRNKEEGPTQRDT